MTVIENVCMFAMPTSLQLPASVKWVDCDAALYWQYHSLPAWRTLVRC